MTHCLSSSGANGRAQFGGEIALVCADVRKYLPLLRENAHFSAVISDRNPLYPFVNSLHGYLDDTALSVVSCENSVPALFSNNDLLSKLSTIDGPLFLFQPLGIETPGLRLAVNPESVHADFENKHWLRKQFNKELAFPPYITCKRHELASMSYDSLSKSSGFQSMAVQLAWSTAGLGTSFVDDPASFADCKESYMIQRAKPDDDIVVSRFIDGQSIAVQCCIADGICYWTGPYREIFDDPQLTHHGSLRHPKYFGAQFGDNWPEDLIPEIDRLVAILYPALAQRGYRGVFGIDLVLGADDEVYVVEVNARCTAVAQVLAGMRSQNSHESFLTKTFRAVVLEQGAPSGCETQFIPIVDKASCLILQNTGNTDIRVGKLRPGIYSHASGELEYIRPGFFESDLRNDYEIALYPWVESQSCVPPGHRYVDILLPFAAMRPSDSSLTSQAMSVVRSVRRWAVS